MHTYRLRDSRVAALDALLRTLPPDDLTTRPTLERELAALRVDSWRVSDRAFRAIGQDWLLGFTDPAALIAALALDPVNSTPVLTGEQAQRIVAIPRTPVRQPVTDYLVQVLNAVDDDPVTGDSLVQSGVGSWLGTDARARNYPFADVVVTLPLRLETLFDPPDADRENDPGAWILSLRVSPDEASIVRDFHYLGNDERAPLETFWNRVWREDEELLSWLDGALAEVAWSTLASQVGAERAAWLVANIPLAIDGERIVLVPDPDLPNEPQPNWVRGMPPQLRVYADVHDGVGGTYPVEVGRLPQDEYAVIDDEQLAMSLPRHAGELEGVWWTSFQRACEVGLGGVFPLETGVDPATIASLYVVGVGDADPGEHFRRQSEAGELSVVPLGTATNALKDDPVTPQHPQPDWRTIARDRLAARLDPQTSLEESGYQIGTALTGSDETLPPFPGHAADNDCNLSHLMVQALWPALWGHWMKDVWGANEHAYTLGTWIMANLYPEGPLPPIRIGDQPYGLLPAVSLQDWAPDLGPNPEDPTLNELLDAMRQILIELRARMARSALPSPQLAGQPTPPLAHSVVGGDVTAFMRILGNPVSSRTYSSRVAAPSNFFLAPQFLDPNTLADIEQSAIGAYREATQPFGFQPRAPYVTAGYWRPIRLPLVQPRRMLKKRVEGEIVGRAWLRVFIERLTEYSTVPNDLAIEALFQSFMYHDDPGGANRWELSTLPDSLLIRLLVYATQLATVWQPDRSLYQDANYALDQQRKSAITLAHQLDDEEWWTDVSDQAPNPPAFGLQIPPARLAAFERAFRATLDGASYRIDPFTIGYGWDRLQRANRDDRRNPRMGVYGWVDGPFAGTPGPTEAGLLHTPSYPQTLAALILRDRFLATQAEGQLGESNRNPWQMDITSRRTRLALEIADEVRMGFHIYEVVGRLVEQVIGTVQDVRGMRQLPEFAMRPERLDPNEVINGDVALKRLVNGPPSFTLPTGSLYQLSPGQTAALQEIAAALDVYADLLVTDGVMQLTQRQIDQAAASMEAAAGFGRPPALQFAQTPPSGYQLSSTVLSALRFEDLPDGDLRATHPAAIADASVAAWAEDAFQGDWIWEAHPLDDGPAQGVTRSTLGLDLLDALTVPSELVTELVRRTLDLPGATVRFPAEWRQLQDAVAALGARPLLAADLGIGPEQRADLDVPVLGELTDRYLALRLTARALVAELNGAATDAARAAVLRRVLPWGVVPGSSPQDRDGILALLLGEAPPAGATDLATLCALASAALQQRIIAAPLGLEEAPEDETDPPKMPTEIVAMANLVATFAAPNARLTVLAKWPVTRLVDATQIGLDAWDADLDETWLTVVAATRANLARLEAIQLERDDLFHAWSSAPLGDPWRTGEQEAIARNRRMREAESVGKLDLSPMTIAYGAPDAWNEASVALGMIDAFGEAIPMAERNTFAAFGFEAPSSRPPQAILLAVPPQPYTELDEMALLQIVRETRLSALARAVRLESLGDLQTVLPAAWLQASGPLAARLEPWPVADWGVS